MIDEEQYRRGDWQPGVPVVMADGSLWHMPRPKVILRAHVDPATRRAVLKSSMPDESDAFRATFERLETSDDTYFEDVTTLALLLLGKNYDIPDEVVPELFAFELGSQSSVELWRGLHAAVSGRVPIRSAG